MKVEREKPPKEFVPVVITCQTQQELDAIVGSLRVCGSPTSANRVRYLSPSISSIANKVYATLQCLLNATNKDKKNETPEFSQL